MAKLDEKIEKLQQQLAEAKKQQAEREAAKRQAEAKKRRAKETRQKLLIGALVMRKLAEGQAVTLVSEMSLKRELDAFLTRPGDRAAFDLPPKA